ncbi:thioredoxin H7-like [Hibiscus syriacus]|uniref:Thioredoxin H7-like n=1 Tax=Hibiscus syriacus TaxID=106335 RepID=A0A6A3AAL2_HIBSY|nr:uncharacterized protein LOC120130399 [Hibiscus syriacus]KAE8701484.1 thioredoxin H7-like [Hibiscus syriacus]
MATAAPTTISSDTTITSPSDGPVLNLINKRIRALRKKYNRILQMEESVSQGKTLNKEQEEVIRSKPAVSALIDELEKLRHPLSSAVSEEISLALQRQTISPQETTSQTQEQPPDEPDHAIEDLLNLLYFGSLFDVKTRNDFTSTMLTRTHERGCCLTYDYVTDDAIDLLSEKDLDSISSLSELLISRPADSSLSHKNALHRCVQHAKLWLTNSDQPIDPNAEISYAGLRERLKKIMALEYFTTTPEMKAPVEVAAAAGTYTTFQVPLQSVPTSVPVEVEDSIEQYQQKEADTSNYQETETGDSQFSSAEELQKDEPELENHPEDSALQQEGGQFLSDMDPNQRDVEPREQQYVPRRSYHNQRGSRGTGGGRRGYSNGRGGRGGGRGGGAYQNGRSQYYDQPENNYHSRNYFNNRGRGGRGGGHPYNNQSSAVQGGHASDDVGVAS